MQFNGAIERERLFNLFSNQPGHEALTHGKWFFCPLCRQPFGSNALAPDQLRLTLAHIIPKALGGTWLTLACSSCNNDSGGRELEADLVRSLRFSDWKNGEGSIKVRMGDAGKVHAYITQVPKENRFEFEITTPMASPAVAEFKRIGEEIQHNEGASGTFRVSLPWCRPSRCWAAVCQSAYLLLFSYFGYDFARHATYKLLREQLIRPDERILTGNIFTLGDEWAEGLLAGKQAAVLFIRRPVLGIVAVLRLRSPVGEDQVLGVILPGPEEPPLAQLSLQPIEGAFIPYVPAAMGSQQGYFWMCWQWWRGECRSKP